jgi:para-nitrobenzyl esterase
MEKKNNSRVIVHTEHGKVRGRKENDFLLWLGVPYAEPPVGELRWKAPRTLKSWEGILDTTDYQSKAMQLENGHIVGSEDCLYLNIWKSDSNEEGLPVLVYVHGGGNLIGSGQEFNGAQLTKHTNSIIVTINYRLGPLGWFKHKSLKTSDPLDDSGNYGLLDIFKSLEWIRDNIEAFGRWIVS